MNHSAGNSKNSDHRWLSIGSDDEPLPKDLGEPLEEEQALGKSQKIAQEDVKNHEEDKNTTSLETLIQIPAESCVPDEGMAQDGDQEGRNTFWISVSGYEYARSYVVYRFFCDIGPIAGKCFTETNLMYLKYFSRLDCQIALSYNGQKIGYGGDISVKVKPENPVTQNTIIEALEKYSDGDSNVAGTNSTSTTVTNDVGAHRDQNVINPHELEVGQAKDFKIIHRKVSIKQWFKEKLSYMFYFY